jgi:hypothetical protein
MADDSAGVNVRSMLVGAGLAGVASVLVLTVLTVASIGSPTVRAIVAVILGVGVAQVYERTR